MICIRSSKNRKTNQFSSFFFVFFSFFFLFFSSFSHISSRLFSRTLFLSLSLSFSLPLLLFTPNQIGFMTIRNDRNVRNALSSGGVTDESGFFGMWISSRAKCIRLCRSSETFVRRYNRNIRVYTSVCMVYIHSRPHSQCIHAHVHV